MVYRCVQQANSKSNGNGRQLFQEADQMTLLSSVEEGTNSHSRAIEQKMIDAPGQSQQHLSRHRRWLLQEEDALLDKIERENADAISEVQEQASRAIGEGGIGYVDTAADLVVNTTRSDAAVAAASRDRSGSRDSSNSRPRPTNGGSDTVTDNARDAAGTSSSGGVLGNDLDHKHKSDGWSTTEQGGSSSGTSSQPGSSVGSGSSPSARYLLQPVVINPDRCQLLPSRCQPLGCFSKALWGRVDFAGHCIDQELAGIEMISRFLGKTRMVTRRQMTATLARQSGQILSEGSSLCRPRVASDDAKAMLHHPCLHEGYSAAYTRLPRHLRSGAPRLITLRGKYVTHPRYLEVLSPHIMCQEDIAAAKNMSAAASVS